MIDRPLRSDSDRARDGIAADGVKGLHDSQVLEHERILHDSDNVLDMIARMLQEHERRNTGAGANALTPVRRGTLRRDRSARLSQVATRMAFFCGLMYTCALDLAGCKAAGHASSVGPTRRSGNNP